MNKQSFCAGILRAVGAQFWALVMIIVSYYFVGLPLGGYLMLGTGLKSSGFWIGIILAVMLLVVFQVVYIVRIDWKKTALDVRKPASQQAIGKQMRIKLTLSLYISRPTTSR